MVDHRVHSPSEFANNRREAASKLQRYREAAGAGGERRSSPIRMDFVRIIP